MSDSNETRSPREGTLSDRPGLRQRFKEALRSQPPDYQGYYLSAIATLARLDTASPTDVAEGLSPEYRQRALEPRRGLPHYIRLLQDLMRAIEAQQPRLTVVRDD